MNSAKSISPLESPKKHKTTKRQRREAMKLACMAASAYGWSTPATRYRAMKAVSSFLPASKQTTDPVSATPAKEAR